MALIECVADLTQPHYKVRRLHLVIVDLWRPWKIHKSQVRSITDQLRRLQPGPQADHTTPMMLQFCALGHAMFNMWLQSPLELIPCLVSGYIKLRVALRLHRQDETGADFDFNQVRVAEDCGARQSAGFFWFKIRQRSIK